MARQTRAARTTPAPGARENDAADDESDADENSAEDDSDDSDDDSDDDADAEDTPRLLAAVGMITPILLHAGELDVDGEEPLEEAGVMVITPFPTPDPPQTLLPSDMGDGVSESAPMVVNGTAAAPP